MYTYEKLANGLPAMIPFADRPHSVALAGSIFATPSLCFLTLHLTTLVIFPDKKQPKYPSVGGETKCGTYKEWNIIQC